MKGIKTLVIETVTADCCMETLLAQRVIINRRLFVWKHQRSACMRLANVFSAATYIENCDKCFQSLGIFEIVNTLQSKNKNWKYLNYFLVRLLNLSIRTIKSTIITASVKKINSKGDKSKSTLKLEGFKLMRRFC